MPQFLVTVAPRETAPQSETVHLLYLLAGPDLGDETVAYLTATLLHDPVVQTARWTRLDRPSLAVEMPPSAAWVLEIAYRPGVTDNEGEMVLEGARRLETPGLAMARTLRRYLLPPDTDPVARAADLANDLIQTTFTYAPGTRLDERLAFYDLLATVPEEGRPVIASAPLREADDAALLRISQEGVLALDLDEMRAIRAYFTALGRDPTDGELETLAQTWSEHCSHKSFKARVRYRSTSTAADLPDAALYPMLHRLEHGPVEIDSLIRTFLMAATGEVLARRHGGSATDQAPLTDDWVLSAFVDNAGIIAFDEDYEVSFKVETHNHPSALEPFGGANTGVGGVIRDVLGVSAEPIANTDILCFGMPDTPATALPPGVLHPARVASSVVAGVRDYGNKLGIPTVNGAVLFDPGYTANPLVYCGTLGIAPRGLHPRNVSPGDAIVLVGGRTGRDGIHGATFSSVELTQQTAVTVGSAVQIGDPITEKKLLDVLLQARDARLYSAITDCGAGGLSSAVGEMGAECGASVELSRVPRKYAGLQPWEVWLSEAQERMVLAVPPANLEAFLDLCASEDVEASVIGEFTNDGRLHVTNQGALVVNLDMEFLHRGRPQRVLEALWQPEPQVPAQPAGALPPPAEALLRLLAHPNIASKERIVRTYDHEVRGATVIKPFVGAALDGPGDAAVLQPLPHTLAGLALGCGINPRYGRVDPYWMALAAVDEAMRNVVAVGGDPQRTAILDNFCWGDPRLPDRMAGLVRAAAGCYDAAVAFGTPFISGKDSLNNEYRDVEGRRIAIPPTLLISALAYVPDVTRCVTMDLKAPGDLLYLVGATGPDLLGSHLAAIIGTDLPGASRLPRVDLAAAPHTFTALHRAMSAGLVQACHDLSEGGLAVAAAEMVIAGNLGLDLRLDAVAQDTLTALFSETPSRFLVEVRPDDASAFEAALDGVILNRLGTVTVAPTLLIRTAETTVLALDVATLRTHWKSGLDGIDL
ncbi:MAG: phosphoribosylformylglycinamidine synthase subunit PurL [Oscillochloridaceae bacterium]|nr:phosphoribosylformylglycinamidine synthase subunit PurL [Chloroflexaceae bacterium]MDW8391036.1 phosphoribosylformylglycinamidine synthase subunit PurL [Oscillochloridaceae bacterium]